MTNNAWVNASLIVAVSGLWMALGLAFVGLWLLDRLPEIKPGGQYDGAEFLFAWVVVVAVLLWPFALVHRLTQHYLCLKESKKEIARLEARRAELQAQLSQLDQNRVAP